MSTGEKEGMNVMGADAHERPSRIPGKKILVVAGLVVVVIIIAAISAYLFQVPQNTEKAEILGAQIPRSIPGSLRHNTLKCPKQSGIPTEYT